MVAIPRTVMTVNKATVKFADTEAGLVAADTYQCVVTRAELAATANLLDIPATGCAPPSQTSALSSWALNLTWLQDWLNGGGLSFYAFDHDAEVVWFSISPSDPEAPPVATGQCTIVAGAYLGEFGTVLTADATFPVQGTPSITQPTTPLAAAASSSAE